MIGDICVTNGYVDLLGTDEQPVQRWINVGEKWVDLPKGWLEQASLLIIQNLGPSPSQVEVSPKIKEDQERCIVEVAMELFNGGIDRMILPITQLQVGRDCRWKPLELDRIKLRCLKGGTKVFITLLPV